MILFINTANNQEIEICLKNGEEILLSRKIAIERTQAEKLLGLIEQVLKKAKIKLSDIESVAVQNSGSSFTSLRVGVATANALGFALGVPVRGADGLTHPVSLGASHPSQEGIFNVVEPIYDREPDIGI
jgi:tRNA threonylcarbamoyladenosine biosynthesis protein TsaB